MSHLERSRLARSGVLALSVALALVVGSGTAFADGAMDVDVMVSIISDTPGEIDSRAKELDQKLRKKIRYESLEVVQTKRLSLGPDDVGSLRLPGGRLLRITPIVVDSHGALIAVEWEGQIDTQMRVKSDHLVVLGPQRHEHGQMVVSLEAHF